MELAQILQTARSVAADTLAPQAPRIDRDGIWPETGLRRLLDAGLGGLVVPRRFGGLGQGLLGLGQVCEVLGSACASTAMCFGMHAVGSAVLAARATPDQADRLIRPIVEGRHLTTLALSEAGTGSYFYIPETRLIDAGDHYRLAGHKSFVTSGGHADSYVLSVASEDTASGLFSCIAVMADTEGMQWQDPWHGLGMRGNSSRNVEFDDAPVAKSNLLGAEGDQVWFVFEVIAPYFLMAMSGVYLGIASRALALAIEDVKQRRHSHTGIPLSKQSLIQSRIGTLWANVERTRQFMYAAAAALDEGRAEALPAVLSVKAEMAECCVHITNEAMTLTGGRAFAANGEMSRLLRDARAAHVMAPTTDLMRVWVGRSVLGEPMLSDEET